MKTYIFFILLCFFIYPVAYATDYYVATNGDNGANGLTEGTAWETFAYADSQISPGDTVIILNGTYSETLNPTTSGTSGSEITWQAETRGSVIIQKTSDGRGIYVYSTPANIKAYIVFDGISARSYGEYDAIYIDSQDNSLEAEMTHNITIKNCSTFGSANYSNTMSFKVSRVRDSLIEDCWAYGFGRKAVQLYGCIRMTVRRMVARYDYWDGAGYKPDDPRIGFAVYNSKNGIYENIIVLDCAPDPPDRTAASKAGVAIEGNVSTTSSFIGSTYNKFLGIVSLNNDYNQFYSSGVSGGENDNNILENIIVGGGDNNGIVLHAYSSTNTLDYVTIYDIAGSGVRANNSNVASNDLSYFAMNGVVSAIFTDSGTNNNLNNYSAINSAGDDVAAEYMPTLDYIVYPTMALNFERGATITKMYVDGTLTSTDLWPWPNEKLIKSQMCNSTDLATVNRISENGAGWEPAWCASGKTLTSYIWEYLGNQIPIEIYGIYKTNGCSPLIN